MRKFLIVKDEELLKYYELFRKTDIIMPLRQTAKSAGYDIYSPYEIVIKPNSKSLIFTGLKIELDDDEFLLIAIRSSMAIKHGLVLTNQVGIIDSDYFSNVNNDGHIIVALTNTTDKQVIIAKHERIAQGIIMKYLVVNDDKAEGTRSGGTGSTGK